MQKKAIPLDNYIVIGWATSVSPVSGTWVPYWSFRNWNSLSVCVWVSRTDREKWRTSWMEYQYPRCWVTQLYDSLARVGWRQILLLKILKGTRYVHNKFENLCFLCFSVHNTTIVEKYPENVFIHSFLILPKEIGIPYIPFCKEKKLNIVSIAWNQKLNASSS